MHPVLDCDLARLRHADLRAAATGPLPAPVGGVGRPASRVSTEVAALVLRRSIAVAERRAARLERETTRLAAALADVEARARSTRARLA